MNAWLGPVALRLSESLPLGRHSQSARGLYKPPPMRLPMKPSPFLGLTNSARHQATRLGDESSFMSPSIGTSFLLIAGGVAGLYLSVLAPAPADSVMKGLSIASTAWGAYSLVTKFFGSSTPQVDNKAKAEAAPMTTMSPEAFAKVNGQIIFPLPDSIPAAQSDWFVPEYFEIKVIWRNDSDEVANFKYNVLAQSVSAPGIPIPGETLLSKVIDDSQVAGLLPHTETGATPLKVEFFQPPQPGSAAKFSSSGKSTYKIYVQLQKIGPSGPVPVGNAVAFGPFPYK